MDRASLAPFLHLFVCANRREADSPLGPGCGPHGDAVYKEMKADVARRGAHRDVWITKTHCLGICPKRGCTVAVHPAGVIYKDVEEADAYGLLADAIAGSLP